MTERCPYCNTMMEVIDHNGQVSSFYKCGQNCNRVFERIYDYSIQKFKYIDIFLVLKDISSSRVAE